jgi:hypothetical protein
MPTLEWIKNGGADVFSTMSSIHITCLSFSQNLNKGKNKLN